MSLGGNLLGNGGGPLGPSFYEQVGGHEFFEALVRDFYIGVAADPVLRAMYPEEDLAPAERRMLLFLEQYWGGPGTYSQERGHPRLRMRHVPFAIDRDARERWLKHMRAALDARDISPMHETQLWDYLERAATAMINRADPPADADGSAHGRSVS